MKSEVKSALNWWRKHEGKYKCENGNYGAPVILADAFAALHQPDDDELATVGWFRDEFGAESPEFWPYSLALFSSSKTRLFFKLIQHAEDSNVLQLDMITATVASYDNVTRGQLRRLLNALNGGEK